MDFNQILLALGVSILIYVITLGVIFFVLIGVFIWLVKKHPIGAIFTFLVLIALATAPAFTGKGIGVSVIAWVTLGILLVTQFKRWRKAFRSL